MVTVSCLILLDSQNTFLATQRPPEKSLGGLWEFPGGKVEEGESPEAALRRELREELHLRVDSLPPPTPVTHRYDFGSIRLVPFLARCDDRPSLKLVEHSAARWLKAGDAHSLVGSRGSTDSRRSAFHLATQQYGSQSSAVFGLNLRCFRALC